jgi:L-malate glycosyltransferase
MLSRTELGQPASTPLRTHERVQDSPAGMQVRSATTQRRKAVLIVAPAAPPYGGMQVQGELLTTMLRAEGFAVLPFASNQPFPRCMRFFEMLRGVRPFPRAAIFSLRLWRELAEVDVVHVLAASWLYFFLVVYPAVLLSRLRRKRVVLNYRAGDAGHFLSVCATLVRPAFRLAHVVTAPSEFLKQVIESGVRVPVTVVPNIANLSVFRYRPRPVFAPRILVARQLQKRYDIASVIRAFSKIQEHRPEASLWIAGTGPEEASLRALVSTCNLGNVQFLGQVEHDHLPAIFDQCDIFLNASRVDNFPGALMEASAAGLVVVTTRAGGIPFLYEDGKNALLVDIGDSDGLALAVEKALEQPALARNLTEAGFELARQFEWSEVRRALIEVYGW